MREYINTKHNMYMFIHIHELKAQLILEEF